MATRVTLPKKVENTRNIIFISFQYAVKFSRFHFSSCIYIMVIESIRRIKDF